MVNGCLNIEQADMLRTNGIGTTNINSLNY